MSGIMDLLGSDLGKTLISGVAGSTGTDASKTSNVLSIGLPLLMKAMQKNAATPEGAQGLAGALTKHDGGILDNIGGLFEGNGIEQTTSEGGKILGHVLGNKAQGIEQLIGQKVGLDSGNVANILKMAAPILMGYLGKQNTGSNENGIGSLLGGLLGGNDNQEEQSLLEKMLDADGDGSVIDDVAGMLLNKGGKTSGGGLTDMLGSFLGK